MGRTARGIRVRRATPRDLDVLVRHRRGMWEDIADYADAELDAADVAYRQWARQRIRSGKLVGFLAETRQGRVVSSGCVWLQEIQPRPGVPDRVQPYSSRCTRSRSIAASASRRESCGRQSGGRGSAGTRASASTHRTTGGRSTRRRGSRGRGRCASA